METLNKYLTLFTFSGTQYASFEFLMSNCRNSPFESLQHERRKSEQVTQGSQKILCDEAFEDVLLFGSTICQRICSMASDAIEEKPRKSNQHF